MRVTLFEYMVVISVSLNFPYPARVTLGESQRVGPAPKCQGVLSWRGPKEVCAAFFAAVLKLLLGGTETLKGRCKRSRTTPCRWAPVWPRSVTPSRGRDTRRKAPQCTEVILTISAAEIRPDCSHTHRGKDSVKGRLRAPSVALAATPRCHAGRFW